MDYPKIFLISGIMALIYSEGSFISKSWTVEEEVIQCFDIETANTNRIKCLNSNMYLLLKYLIGEQLNWISKKIDPKKNSSSILFFEKFPKTQDLWLPSANKLVLLT